MPTAPRSSSPRRSATPCRRAARSRARPPAPPAAPRPPRPPQRRHQELRLVPCVGLRLPHHAPTRAGPFGGAPQASDQRMVAPHGVTPLHQVRAATQVSASAGAAATTIGRRPGTRRASDTAEVRATSSSGRTGPLSRRPRRGRTNCRWAGGSRTTGSRRPCGARTWTIRTRCGPRPCCRAPRRTTEPLAVSTVQRYGVAGSPRVPTRRIFGVLRSFTSSRMKSVPFGRP